ncbi:mCG140979, partial [Mus musculus]
TLKRTQLGGWGQSTVHQAGHGAVLSVRQAQLAVFLLGSSCLAFPRSGLPHGHPQLSGAPPSTKHIISVVCQSLWTTGRKRR